MVKYFYPLQPQTLAFILTLVRQLSLLRTKCYCTHETLKIFHTLQQYCTGTHVEIPFTSDKYLREYESLYKLIEAWIDKWSDKWDDLSVELGLVALCVHRARRCLLFG